MRIHKLHGVLMSERNVNNLRIEARKREKRRHEKNIMYLFITETHTRVRARTPLCVRNVHTLVKSNECDNINFNLFYLFQPSAIIHFLCLLEIN